jgi:hypothetical protein
MTMNTGRLQARQIGTSMVAAAMVIGIALLACGKKETYSPSCKNPVPMTLPWAGMNLPVGEGRVCSSTNNRLEVQFTKGTRDQWFGQFESAVTTAGFEKRNCTSQSCSYQRGKERVQIVGLDAQKWKTVVLHM